jgi:uncharacterized membrane protein YeaQ/YmgE (transglycosylase-associated protein family)
MLEFVITFVSLLIIGTFAGLLISIIRKDSRSGFIKNLIIGLSSFALANFITDLFGLEIHTEIIGGIIISTIIGLLLLSIFTLFQRKPKK